MPNIDREPGSVHSSDGRVLAVLSYLSILCIIPLVLKKDDDFVCSHGRQGLILFVGEVAVFILSILFPGLLKPGIFILSVFSFIGIVAVLKGRAIDLPVVSKIAKKITL